MPADSSCTKLAAALKAIPGVPPSMPVLADAGYYHDFAAPVATPALQLITDLRTLARDPILPRESRRLVGDLVGQIVAGDFDATKAEADAWARSPEGREAMRVLAGLPAE